MDHNGSGSGDRDAIKSDGSIVTHTVAVGCTLANSSTYYFVVGSQLAPTPSQTSLVTLHLAWAAAVAATFTVETCNFPATRGGALPGPDDVKDYDATAGNWIQENPSTAYVGVTGSGNTVSSLTITAGGTAAGGAMIHLGNIGSRRVRIKAVVTTGGNVRCNAHGKAGA